MAEFRNKNVLVTGAANGIGRATALLFAERGAKVVVSDIDETALQSVVEEIDAAGGVVKAIACDVSDRAAVKRLVDGAVEVFGRLEDRKSVV